MKNLLIAAALLLAAPAIVDAQTREVAVPEGLETSYETLLADWTAKKYLEIDSTDCQTLEQNPEFDSETYAKRLSRLPYIIAMPYNDLVRQFIDRYTVKMRPSMPLVLGASNFYTPIFEDALERYGLPLELKYLPLVESCYNSQAVSRAGATGLWQFMLSTAKQYGLTVNSLLDERMDAIKASDAAARFLSDLYRIFADWTLVVAAYNCGPENVNKAIRRAGGDTRDYWKIYPYLPAETQGYVPAFIAANYVMTYYCDHGICPARATLPAGTDTVVVSRNVHFDQISAVCHLPLEQIKALNPQFRRDIVPGESQPSILRLPHEAVAAFISAGDSVYSHRAEELLPSREIEVAQSTPVPAAKPNYIKVRRGDTLGAIAKRNGTTVARLRELNGIKGNNITAGQKLRVK